MTGGRVDAAHGPPDPPDPRRRLLVGAAAAVLTALVVAVTLGLAAGGPLGAEDNGDGHRLFCGVGLYPRTVDGLALWKGGVVGDFSVGPPSCGLWMPSSAGVVLRAAALGRDTLTVTTVAWWYVALAALAVGVAAWAAAATRCRRAAVLVVPAAPLALVPFTRFFASTYAEPAGLVGTVALGCGLAALVAAGPGRVGARRAALAVALLGGMLAATAKVAYLPVLAATVAVVAVALATRAVVVGRRVVLVGGLVAAVAVAAPVWGAAHFQQQVYEGANVHDVVFTMALAELGPDGPAQLGLPPEADDVVGNGFFNGPPLPTAPWWLQATRERPAELRADAVTTLARHPAALLRTVGVGLQATTRADLPYLAAAPADPARPSAPAGDPGWSGSHQPELGAVLDASTLPPWAPSALVLGALVAAGSTVLWRRRAPAAARWCHGAGLGALTALGLVVTALWGDGYFEVFKHVWLAAAVLVVTGMCLVAAAVAAVAALARRPPRVPGPVLAASVPEPVVAEPAPPAVPVEAPV